MTLVYSKAASLPPTYSIAIQFPLCVKQAKHWDNKGIVNECEDISLHEPAGLGTFWSNSTIWSGKSLTSLLVEFTDLEEKEKETWAAPTTEYKLSLNTHQEGLNIHFMYFLELVRKKYG